MKIMRFPAMTLFCALLVTSTAAATASPAAKPWPFASDAEAVAFLENATVVSIEKIPTGVTQPRKVLLEMDGTRAYAVFRDVDVLKEQVRLHDGTFHAELRDSALFEVAAYRLAVRLGLDNVPPTVLRSIGNTEGSLQLWVEGAMTEEHRRRNGLRPPNYAAWLAQMRMMTLFDCLVGNIDRNAGNYLLDESGKLWMIDHTRAFQRYVDGWTPEKIAMCERRVWQRLQGLDREALDAMLGDVLTTFEINRLAERVEGVVAHISTQIALRGEDEVIIGRVTSP